MGQIAILGVLNKILIFRLFIRIKRLILSRYEKKWLGSDTWSLWNMDQKVKDKRFFSNSVYFRYLLSILIKNQTQHTIFEFI